MEIKDIEHLAKLARIELSEEEKRALMGDMERILEFVGQIREVAGDEAAEPALGAVHNVMREDGEPHDGGVFTDELIAAAPSAERGYVKVKKIL